MASDLIVDTIEKVVTGYCGILSHTVVPPAKMVKLKGHSSLNIGAILFATGLLLLAKALAGYKANIFDSFVVNLLIALTSMFLLFVLPTIILLVRGVTRRPLLASDDDEGEAISDELVDKVTSAAIFIWIFSLILFIIDYLLYTFNSYSFIWFANQNGSDTVAHLMAVIFYTLVAGAFLLIRSRRGAKFAGNDWFLALFTTACLCVINAIMMYYLVYGIQQA